ncbi:hypothetical protein C8Q73DRAFT_664178 [Cubamyces lactineus]|nr:hypothetical protein C8Q73DRAFT_664178 [Cubamyces lactineus]
MSAFPDYYKLLNIQQNATIEEVRTAYKKESLKLLMPVVPRTHPDRLVNATPAEKQAATERFQAVADAYYVLSDPTRRKEYDMLYNTRRPQEKTDQPSASANFFSTFTNMFGGAAGAQSQNAAGAAPADRPDAEHVFADVFEELLRPEVERHVPWWTWIGALCGAGLGFIIANIPGLMVGMYAGNRLGAIRDAKGKSVAAVFNQLGGSQKAEVLRALAAKVLVPCSEDGIGCLKPGRPDLPGTIGASNLRAPAARRASSVPAVGSRKAEYILAHCNSLDCVLMTPRKRSEELGWRENKLARRSPAQQQCIAGPAIAPRKLRLQPTEEGTFAGSPDPGPVGGEGAHIDRPSSSPLRRASSRVPTPQRRTVPGSRIAGVLAASRRNKGKGRAVPVDFETSSQANPEDAIEAESPTSGARRSAKRRRLSPRLPPDARETSTTATLTEEDVDYQQAALDDDFQMLDMPDDAALPWVPMNPESKEATYVPPGLNALIEDMKRALVLQMSARQKAENMHAEELQRRRELEHEAARLAAANRALEAERSAWTASAAEALASTLESALAADMSRRFAAETPPGVFLEEMPQYPNAMATDPSGDVSAIMDMGGGFARTSGADPAGVDAARNGEPEPEAIGPSTLTSTAQAAMPMRSA